LAAELRHEVAETAVRVAILLSEGLITALETFGRLKEEVFTQGVIHG
jgi:hypothetical protein